MNVSVFIENSFQKHAVQVETDSVTKSLKIDPKPDGYASSVNGAELLLAAIGTCFCNDVYREAKARQVTVEAVSVRVKAEFGGPGEPARTIEYEAEVVAPSATKEEVQALLAHVDAIAEIHNTLRRGLPINFKTPLI